MLGRVELHGLPFSCFGVLSAASALAISASPSLPSVGTPPRHAYRHAQLGFGDREGRIPRAHDALLDPLAIAASSPAPANQHSEAVAIEASQRFPPRPGLFQASATRTRSSSPPRRPSVSVHVAKATDGRPAAMPGAPPSFKRACNRWFRRMRAGARASAGRELVVVRKKAQSLALRHMVERERDVVGEARSAAATSWPSRRNLAPLQPARNRLPKVQPTPAARRRRRGSRRPSNARAERKLACPSRSCNTTACSVASSGRRDAAGERRAGHQLISDGNERARHSRPRRRRTRARSSFYLPSAISASGRPPSTTAMRTTRSAATCARKAAQYRRVDAAQQGADARHREMRCSCSFRSVMSCMEPTNARRHAFRVRTACPLHWNRGSHRPPFAGAKLVLYGRVPSSGGGAPRARAPCQRGEGAPRNPVCSRLGRLMSEQRADAREY